MSCGVYVLGAAALERLPERGDHERTTFPELAPEGRLAAFRHEGLWLTVNTPKDLRQCRGACPQGGLTLLGGWGRTDLPCAECHRTSLDLDRFAVEVKRVEKPWGYELVYAATDRYCGKIIFVKAGEELSLQFHRTKDETIYVQSGRVEFEIGDPGEARRTSR